ncbi:hypothetical protein [Rheinheimera sp. MM224]|uniref:hypothetical protein n=1 Tax=Rheinheimera sp. MM224 TaxID=3019969 RepID=UPI0021F88007|nr:hypothetical protein [Rheinheimera sp. MM224]CAI3803159.1 hypothetical protein JAMGFMIE_03291 [Rheinheimera sp. MM224]
MIISSCEGINNDFCRFVLSNKQHLSFYDTVFVVLFITLTVFWGYRYFKRIHEEVRKTKDINTVFKVIGKSFAWLWLYVIVASSVYSVFAYLAMFYSSHIGEGLSTDPAVWGQAGDFFGGMLNPFLAFCSFMALLYTIRIQSEELRLTRDELAKTSKANEKLSEANESQLLLSKLQNFEQLFLKALDQFENDLKVLQGCRFTVKYYFPDMEKRLQYSNGYPIYKDIVAQSPALSSIDLGLFGDFFKNKSGSVSCDYVGRSEHREAVIIYGESVTSTLDKYVFCDTQDDSALTRLIIENYVLFEKLIYSLKYSLHAIYQLRWLAAEGKDFSDFYCAQFKRKIPHDLLIFLCVICSHYKSVPYHVLSECKFFEDLVFDEDGFVAGGLVNIKNLKLPYSSYGNSKSYLAFKAYHEDAKAQGAA